MRLLASDNSLCKIALASAGEGWLCDQRSDDMTVEIRLQKAFDSESFLYSETRDSA